MNNHLVVISAAPGAGKSYFLDQIATICSSPNSDLKNYFDKKNILPETKQLCSDLDRYCEKKKFNKYEIMEKILNGNLEQFPFLFPEHIELYDALKKSFWQFQNKLSKDTTRMRDQFLLEEFRLNLEHSVSISITFNSGCGLTSEERKNPFLSFPLRILYR